MIRKIGFDLDDVLLNFSDPLREYMNKKYSKSVLRSDITGFFTESIFGIGPEDTVKTIEDFFTHDDHINTLPVEGSRDVIKRLSQSNELHIVTAKPEHIKEITNIWLEKHFPGNFKQVHFANFFGSQMRRKKSEICLELGVDIFIDDSLDNAIDISDAGIPVLLFDAPWNQSENIPENVTRVYTWSDIEKYLL